MMSYNFKPFAEAMWFIFGAALGTFLLAFIDSFDVTNWRAWLVITLTASARQGAIAALTVLSKLGINILRKSDT